MIYMKHQRHTGASIRGYQPRVFACLQDLNHRRVAAMCPSNLVLLLATRTPFAAVWHQLTLRLEKLYNLNPVAFRGVLST